MSSVRTAPETGPSRRHQAECVGTITVLGHCTFEWRQNAGSFCRTVTIEPQQCERCVAEVERLASSIGFLFERRP